MDVMEVGPYTSVYKSFKRPMTFNRRHRRRKSLTFITPTSVTRRQYRLRRYKY